MCLPLLAGPKPPCPYEHLRASLDPAAAKKTARLEGMLASSAHHDGSPLPLGHAISSARKIAEKALAKGTKADDREDAEHFLEAVLFLENLVSPIGRAEVDTLATLSEDPDLFLGFVALGKARRAEGDVLPSKFAEGLAELAEKAATLKAADKLTTLLDLARSGGNSKLPVHTSPAAPAAAPLSAARRRAQQVLAEAMGRGKPAYARKDAELFGEAVKYLESLEGKLGAARAAALLDLLQDPAQFQGFVALGKLSQHPSWVLPKQVLEDTLWALAEHAPKMTREEARDFLTAAVKTLGQTADASGNFSKWSSEAIPQLLQKHTEKSREDLKATLIDELKIEPPDQGRISRRIVDTVFLSDSPAVRNLLRRFFAAEKLKAMPFEDQETLFYYLASAENLAAKTSDPMRAELLRNTINVIVDGNLAVEITELDPHVLGNAGTGVIRLNRKHLLGPGASVFTTTKSDALDTLGHEVSHWLSPQKVSATAGYFEEEMRAWMVGFYMNEGRLPTKREAAQRAKFLLTYTDEKDAYSYIARAWKERPETFRDHLQQLGLGEARPDLGNVGRLADQVSMSEPAPQWGWEGFLVNRRAPADFHSGVGRGPSEVAQRFAASTAKLRAAGVDPSLIEELRQAVAFIGFDERNRETHAQAMQPVRRQIEKLSEQPDPPRAAEEALAVFRVMKDIVLRFAVSPGPAQTFLVRAGQNPFFQPAFVALSKSRKNWDEVEWLLALETVATRAHKLDAEKANQALLAFAQAATKKAQAANNPRWTEADTAALFREPATPANVLRWLFPKKAGN